MLRLRNCAKPVEAKVYITESGVSGPDDIIIDID
jgi:hypothetical protein